ncbi:hypothetical protein DFH27DRAFT_161641 [Peziza echinospora]|nr:hypothetical protein DFH27DRAFT_161641 [Peziza echinospora]
MSYCAARRRCQQRDAAPSTSYTHSCSALGDCQLGKVIYLPPSRLPLPKQEVLFYIMSFHRGIVTSVRDNRNEPLSRSPGSPARNSPSNTTCLKRNPTPKDSSAHASATRERRPPRYLSTLNPQPHGLARAMIRRSVWGGQAHQPLCGKAVLRPPAAPPSALNGEAQISCLLGGGGGGKHRGRGDPAIATTHKPPPFLSKASKQMKVIIS